MVTRRTVAVSSTGPDRAAHGAAPEDAVQVLGDLRIDRRTRQVQLGGKPITLAPKEFDLLALLAEDPGAVCSRQQILGSVWHPNFFGPTKTLDVHSAALRRKLGDPGRIETLRRVGFRLTAAPGHAASASGQVTAAPGPAARTSHRGVTGHTML